MPKPKMIFFASDVLTDNAGVMFEKMTQVGTRVTFNVKPHVKGKDLSAEAFIGLTNQITAWVAAQIHNAGGSSVSDFAVTCEFIVPSQFSEPGSGAAAQADDR